MGVDVADLPACPPALLDALRAHAPSVERLTDHAPRYHARLSSADGPLFAWYSHHPDDREALAHELAVRAFVGTEGVLASPPVLASGDTWRLERMIVPEPLGHDDNVGLVIEAWQRLTALDLPRRRSTPTGGSTFERLIRRARLVASPLPVADVVRARKLADDPTLPRVTAHGDFHAAHVLPLDGTVWVIDWELSGRGPLGLDLMQLWASLSDEALRDRLMAAALDAVGPAHDNALLRLRYVALVRRIASKVAELSRFGDRDEADAQRLLSLLPEARAAVT